MKKNGFFAEFKKFITRGNVMDLAVGVIIGGAFTSIVTSLNSDIISPLLGIFGGIDFSQYSVALFGTGAVLKYGSFLTAVINFLITSLVIFLLIKGVNTITDKFKKHDEEKPAPTTKNCPFCKSEIAIDAIRCPHCTSVLEVEDDDAEAKEATE